MCDALVESGARPVVRLVHAIEGIGIELLKLFHLRVNCVHVCFVGPLRVVDVEPVPAHVCAESKVHDDKRYRVEWGQSAQQRVQAFGSRIDIMPPGVAIVWFDGAESGASYQEVRPQTSRKLSTNTMRQ